MSEPASREIDLLEALAEGIEDLLAALEQTSEASSYLDGQAAFFEAALAAIDEAGPDERPQPVLERAAAGLDVELEDAELADPPLEGQRAGVLGAWGICVGYLEGFHAGANTVIAEVEDAASPPPSEG